MNRARWIVSLFVLATTYAVLMHRRASGRRFLEFTPFVGFCAFEILAAWSAPLFGPVRNSALAFVMGLAFVALICGYAIHALTHRGFRYRLGEYITRPLVVTRPAATTTVAVTMSMVLGALTVYLYGFDLPGVDVEAAHLKAGLFEDQRERQADVALADDADDCGAVANACKCLIHVGNVGPANAQAPSAYQRPAVRHSPPGGHAAPRSARLVRAGLMCDAYVLIILCS